MSKRRYKLERTDFIGCRNTSYMDVDDAEPCPFGGADEYNACIAALKTWNNRYSKQ